MLANQSRNGGQAPERGPLFEDADFLFELVTEEEFEQKMRMTNSDIPVGSINWRNAKSVSYLRRSKDQATE